MHLPKIAVVAVAVLTFAGCGGGGDQGKTDNAERVCRSQHGAEVCLQRNRGPWTLRAKGFKPGSELTQAVSNEASPVKSHVGDDGTYPPSNATAAGVVVPSGQKATLIVTGTAKHGENVRLSIPVTS